MKFPIFWGSNKRCKSMVFCRAFLISPKKYEQIVQEVWVHIMTPRFLGREEKKWQGYSTSYMKGMACVTSKSKEWSSTRSCLPMSLKVLKLGGGNSNIFGFFIPIWWRFPFWRAYFSDRLKPMSSRYPDKTQLKTWQLCRLWTDSVVLNQRFCHQNLGKMNSFLTTVIFFEWVETTT